MDARTKPILDFLRARQKDEGADPLATAAANALDDLVEQYQAARKALDDLSRVSVHKADAPLRPIWYRIYRSVEYDPTNAEARIICERVRELEGAITRATLVPYPAKSRVD